MKAALNQRCCSYVESSLTMHNRLIFCSFLLVDSVNMVGMLINVVQSSQRKLTKIFLAGLPRRWSTSFRLVVT